MYMNRRISLCLLTVAIGLNVSAQSPQAIKTFAYNDLSITGGVFKQAATTDLRYMMQLEPDRLLAPYLREAGLPAKAKSYENWENTGLDGHIGGHYVSALAMMYASYQDAESLKRLNYMIDELKRCQDQSADGYIGGVPGSKELWMAVMAGNIEAINKKWVPFYNIHKTFAGLRDAYLFAGNTKAKDMLIKYADWFVKVSTQLSVAQMQQMLRTEHGGVNEVLADVYQMTNDKKYLDAARKFSQESILQPLVSGEDKLDNLHANTQIPKIIGFERIAELSGDKDYAKAAEFFWQTVVDHRTVAIGGNSVREHFNPSKNFSSMISSEQGPETCNTYNMLKLTRMLFQKEGMEKYINFYERALFNHILSTQHPENGGFVYFTPMRPGHYRVYSQPQEAMWCCVGSGMENHAKYNELIYAHTNDDLFVNLFIQSKLNWKDKGITLVQKTNFPEEQATTLEITAAKPVEASLQLRYPSWVQEGKLTISVNGKNVPVSAKPGSYVAVKRVWKTGDKVRLLLPMQNRVEQMPDGSNYFAFLHGPIVLAAKTTDADLRNLKADGSRMGHVANGRQYPLRDMPSILSKDDNLTAALKPVPGKPLNYSFAALAYPEKYKSLELMPFYQLHDSRYVIYWEKQTPASLKAREVELAREAEAASRLADSTVDYVAAGEQQPESDHFMESEASNSGVNQDRHWRDARGWFSYKMLDRKQEATRLRVTYSGGDRGRSFKILVNGTELAAVKLAGNRGDQFYTIDYPLPAQKNSQWVIKFVADQGSIAGGVYEARLLNK